MKISEASCTFETCRECATNFLIPKPKCPTCASTKAAHEAADKMIDVVKKQLIGDLITMPVYIGVDPAFREGGFWIAVVDMTDRTVAYRRFADVLEWHDYLRSGDSPLSCFVCVENSNLQNKSFDISGSKMEVARKGRNVGTNQAVSELAFRSAVRRYGVDRVFEVSPKEKGPKWSEAQAGAVLKSERLTVVTNGENQDCRDALKLALMARQKALIAGRFKAVEV